MSSSLKDALKEAYQSKGIELPDISTNNIKNSRNLSAHQTKPNKDQSDSIIKSSLIRKKENKVNNAKKLQINIAGISAYSPPPPKNSIAQELDNKDFPFEVTIKDRNQINFLITDDPDYFEYFYPSPPLNTNHNLKSNYDEEREIVIGLDFGTSSVKVVIGDHQLGKAFAVPFSQHDGIKKYLLPSRLYEKNNTYQLNKISGGNVHRNLKLSLFNDSQNQGAITRTTAFLALIIQHAKFWLLTEHIGIYQKIKIFWKLCLGTPSAHHLKVEHQDLLKIISQAAWSLSLQADNYIERVRVEHELKYPLLSDENYCEISIVPEIAAQIYGYVSSNSFDPNAQNCYLMVDIGAGTIDSCLFRVIKSTGGKWEFIFYTTQVQPHGVMNLHRNRLTWWKYVLHKFSILHIDNPIFVEISDLENQTDNLSSIPESFDAYFTGIDFNFKDAALNPDNKYFKNIGTQVRGKTLWRTWKDGYLAKEDLMGIPMYLCGGGARMDYYKNIENTIYSEGASWLNAKLRKLNLPKSLIAPNLSVDDFDRMSVAYGLSFLNVKKVIQAIPELKIQPEPILNWGFEYVSKDDC